MDEDVTIPNKKGNQNEIALILLHFTSEYNMEPRGKWTLIILRMDQHYWALIEY